MTSKLFDALDRGDHAAMEALLRVGADPDAVMPEWPHWRPLHAAIEALDDGTVSVEAIATLLRHGADPNAWDGAHDATPVLMAVFRGAEDAVALLLAAGADPNVVGAEGDSPLRWCAERGDTKLARLLLDHGAAATIDTGGGPAGANALGIAARRSDADMVTLLLEAGASPTARDVDRLTALERMRPMHDVADTEAWKRIRQLLGG